MVAQHVRADPPQHVLVEAHGVPGDERPELPRRTHRGVGGQPREEPADAQRPLDRGDLGAVEPGGGHALDEVAHRAQRHRLLAQARQHALDVGRVRGGRPDDEDAAVLEAPALGVQEVRGTVEGDDRLAGAGAAADLGDAARGGADGLVLVALDRRDDVAHLAAAAAGQGGDERPVAEHDDVLGRLGDHEVVLGADDGGALAPQHPASHDTHRVDGGRAVERGGGGRPPVDDERLVVVVTHAEAPDVADLALVRGGLLGAEVQPAEHEPLVLLLDRGAAPGGGEDEGVALEEAGHLLVAHVAGAVGAAARQPVGLDVGGAQAGLLELGVDPVHVRLLVGELRGDVGRGVGHRVGGGHGTGSPGWDG